MWYITHFTHNTHTHTESYHDPRIFVSGKSGCKTSVILVMVMVMVCRVFDSPVSFLFSFDFFFASIPGVLKYKGSKVQVLDLPGIIEGAAHGAGRGKEVIAVARSADAILIVLDAGKEGLQKHREILERELETVGIRLNQRRPDVTVSKRKAGGGCKFASTCPQPHLGPEPEKLVTQILREYKVTSADVLAREEITVDQLVDVIQGNREYKPCLYLYNKIDTVTIEEIDQLARMPHSLVGSVHKGFNIAGPDEDDFIKQKMWEYLGLTRVYTKRKGSPPDLSEPVILSQIRRGTTVKSLCANISSELLRDFNYALVWGMSAKVRFYVFVCTRGGNGFVWILSNVLHRYFCVCYSTLRRDVD